MIAAAPLLGPDTGGTEVSLLLSGSVQQSQLKNLFCKFGPLVVEVSSFHILSVSQAVSIVCVAPPRAGPQDVPIHVSLDGNLFSISGAGFHYHAPLFIASVAPHEVSMPLEGGVALLVTLDEGGALGAMFGPRFDPDVTTIPAACFFGRIKVAAESFDAISGEITCIAPAVRRAQWVELRVSLDSQVRVVRLLIL